MKALTVEQVLADLERLVDYEQAPLLRPASGECVRAVPCRALRDFIEARMPKPAKAVGE